MKTDSAIRFLIFHFSAPTSCFFAVDAIFCYSTL
jgi:hypothetical protein